jgi:hypothetical protein
MVHRVHVYHGTHTCTVMGRYYDDVVLVVLVAAAALAVAL